ncbi:hypothetical protein SUGI_0546970 [Cryptomeria japonica]|nr:hypothetical protein SUGI_0546970 [Cryptomeria japonica]
MMPSKREIESLNTQLVAASVIATIAFQAMFQIPGGIEDDDKKSIHYGVAKIAFDKAFRLFIFSDTVAFFAFLTVVASWYIRLQFPQEYARNLLFQFPALSLLVSIISTVIAFMCATIVIAIPKNLDSLESKNKEGGSKYDSLLVYDMLYPALLPVLIATVCEVWSRAVRLLMH